MWYTANLDTQGLIVDEETGRNVAVSYDAKDARLIAATPKLLKALENAVTLLEAFQSKTDVPPAVLDNMLYEARAAIREATKE